MTATAPPPPVTTDELADRLGVIPRTVRHWIAQGMPGAEKAGRPPRWRVDLTEALPWIAAHASGVAGRAPIAGLGAALELADDTPPPGANGQADRDPDLEGIERHIDRLDRLLGGFTELLFNARDFDPRLVTSVKSISTELRRLELHRAEMRALDARLMEREDHARILGTFARLVVDELEAWARSTPDQVVDALTTAGVKVRAKRTTRVLDSTLTAAVEELRTRIADAVGLATEIA